MAYDFGLGSLRGGAMFKSELGEARVSELSGEYRGAGDMVSAGCTCGACGGMVRLDANIDFAAPSPIGPSPQASPSFAEQVTYLNALNPNGTLSRDSYWGDTGRTARKFGDPTAGEGATVKVFFNANLTAQEIDTFEAGMALWSAVADITFVRVATLSEADMQIREGNDGSAYWSASTTNGSGSTLGQYTGTPLLSVDGDVFGFELTGSLDTAGGYGVSTVNHELGHALGLGHGGNYNGAVNPATQQYSQFDERQWTTMSYIDFRSAGTAKFGDEYEVTGTNWGLSEDGITRQAPHTWMPADIIAAQALYGESESTLLDGRDTFGFNCNVGGDIQKFFDFTINTSPVITLFSLGTKNTFDCSGFDNDLVINLAPGTFSSVGTDGEGTSLLNNVAIDFNTVIESGIGGSGNDIILGGDAKNKLTGGGGDDTLDGGVGKDKLKGGGGDDFFGLGSASAADADKIQDFGGGDVIGLVGDVFGLAEGALKAKNFVVGASAGDGSDRIIYDDATGKLYFDSDGTGAQGQVLIATLSGAPTIDVTDFIVV